MRKTLEAGIERRLQETGLPGVSIAVVTNDNLACYGAIGLADKATGERLSNGHMMQACSISKFVSAIITLRVAEMYKVDLDADINNYLTSWHMPHAPKDGGTADAEVVNAWPGNSNPKPVSLRSLLCHQAGLLDPDDSFDSLAPGETAPTLLEILSGQTRLLPQSLVPTSVPYERFAYSDAGYCVIEQVLQDITEMSFVRLAEELLFGPLGLSASECRVEQPLQPLQPQQSSQPSQPTQSPQSHQPGSASMQIAVAKGHTAGGEVLAIGEPAYPYLAAAGLWCTASAYARILLEVMQAMEGCGKVLTPALAKDLFTEPGAKHIGLGNFSSGLAKNPFVYALGWGKGFQCEFRMWPEEASGCIVMINANPGMEQSESLVGEITTLLMEEFNLGR